MDSREYRFIYSLRNKDDIPADFPQEIRNYDFESGVFVPQSDPSWFAQQLASPARLLLLKGRSLQIVSHPASTQQPVEIDFRDLLQFETGTVLLVGWLKWTTSRGMQELRYNTRASNPMDQLVRTLRRRWLAEEPKLDCGMPPARYGDELDIKFKNLLREEVDADEAVRLLYFQPPAKRQRTVLLRRRTESEPGNLICLTTERLLWITDRYKCYRDPYLSVNRSVPITLVRGGEFTQESGSFWLSVSFDSGMKWSMAVDARTRDLESFVEALREATRSKN